MRHRKFLFVQVLAILSLFAALSACSKAPADPKPPEIAYGQDMCDRCGMIIGEPQFASATLLTNGKYLKFDDMGEMLAYHLANPQEQVAAWFVHDYNSQEWINGETAVYVYSESFATPMGTGIVAFSTRAGAEQFAAQNNGMVYTLSEIKQKIQAGGM
jgi:copper chaperone NosL